MSGTNSVVAIYDSFKPGEKAIRKLQKNGFNMKQLSIIGNDYRTDEHVVGDSDSLVLDEERTGDFWGPSSGLLIGAAIFWIPGFGQLLVAGPLVMRIVGVLEETVVVGGVSTLGAALYSIGIPQNSVLKYESEVKNGKFLLMVHGTNLETDYAQEILHQTGAKATTVHSKQVAVSV